MTTPLLDISGFVVGPNPQFDKLDDHFSTGMLSLSSSIRFEVGIFNTRSKIPNEQPAKPALMVLYSEIVLKGSLEGIEMR